MLSGGKNRILNGGAGLVKYDPAGREKNGAVNTK